MMEKLSEAVRKGGFILCEIFWVSTLAKPFALKFYKSKAWQQCRAAYIASVFGICERCGGPGLIVHHKIMLTPENINNPDVTLNFDNLEYLCLDCHNREHGNVEDVVRDGLKFDERGDLVRT